MNLKNTICFSVVTITLIYSINLHMTIGELEKENKILINQNEELKNHIKFLDKEIQFREDEISYMGYRCDSLSRGIVK